MMGSVVHRHLCKLSKSCYSFGIKMIVPYILLAIPHSSSSSLLSSQSINPSQTKLLYTQSPLLHVNSEELQGSESKYAIACS